jgi:hypothetical protein
MTRVAIPFNEFSFDSERMPLVPIVYNAFHLASISLICYQQQSFLISFDARSSIG